MTAIVLATINARYVHAAVGLRYLKANMGALFDDTEIIEFVLGVGPMDMVEAHFKRAPRGRVTSSNTLSWLWSGARSSQMVVLLSSAICSRSAADKA